MRLKDRIAGIGKALREYPALRASLGAATYEREQAELALEQKTQECEHLHGMVKSAGNRLRRAECRSSALMSALREFSPKLSGAAEMKRFYETVAPFLDAGGFTLYRMAEHLTEMRVRSLFPYEEACGVFEKMDGRELLRYLTAGYFNAVDWEVVPGTTYEKAVLREIDIASPEYQDFEFQLYEMALERMGFEDFIAPDKMDRTLEPEQTDAMRSPEIAVS